MKAIILMAIVLVASSCSTNRKLVHGQPKGYPEVCVGSKQKPPSYKYQKYKKKQIKLARKSRSKRR